MENTVKRLNLWAKTHPRVAIGSACALLIVLILVIWRPWADASHNQTTEHTLEVSPGPFHSDLTVSGIITPGPSIDITAPFSGTISAIRFSYGDMVPAQKTLIVLNTDLVEQKLRDAEVSYLKTKKIYDSMQHWMHSPEVIKARRAVDDAQHALQQSQRKADETKILLDKGLVARNEYTSLTEQIRTLTLALKSAEESLNTTIASGQGPAKKIATLNYTSARITWETLQAEEKLAEVKTPVSGVIARPQTSASAQTPGQLYVGEQITQGQLIGSIAQSGRLDVKILLSEVDIENIHVGQKVSVTGPAFPDKTLTGTIASVSEEALANRSGDGGANFSAMIRLNALTTRQAKEVRIGMSANVMVTTYSTANALVIPMAAVLGSLQDPHVEVRKTKHGTSHIVPVTIGHTGPDGAEVTSGLKKGDIVVWQTTE